MTPARCPSCDAALPAAAQWCTLCYADLRPPVEPEPVPAALPVAVVEPEPVAAVEPEPVAVVEPELVAAATGAAPAVPVGRHALRDADRPVMTSADAAVAGRPGWPCQTCGESVPLDLTECPQCGSAFLAAAKTAVGVKLPVVGEITEMSTGGRFGLMAGGAVVVTLVFFVLLVVLGAIF